LSDSINWRALSYEGRHRKGEQPPQRDLHSAQLGAHCDDPEPFRREGAISVAELITKEPPADHCRSERLGRTETP
jgi:hypothetical protein